METTMIAVSDIIIPNEHLHDLLCFYDKINPSSFVTQRQR